MDDYERNIIHSTDERSIRSRIFVGNVNPNIISREGLKRRFSRYGRVLAVVIFKGYAFVQLEDEETARLAATGEDQHFISGQKIDCNLACEPKQKSRNLGSRRFNSTYRSQRSPERDYRPFGRTSIRSPVRSPIRSSIRSPVRSPIRSSIRSPIRSPIRSSIRSPVRSPNRLSNRSPFRSTKQRMRSPESTRSSLRSPRRSVDRSSLSPRPAFSKARSRSTEDSRDNQPVIKSKLNSTRSFASSSPEPPKPLDETSSVTYQEIDLKEKEREKEKQPTEIQAAKPIRALSPVSDKNSVDLLEQPPMKHVRNDDAADNDTDDDSDDEDEQVKVQSRKKDVVDAQEINKLYVDEYLERKKKKMLAKNVSSKDFLACGTCHSVFSSLLRFVKHKRRGCSSSFVCSVCARDVDKVGDAKLICAADDCNASCDSAWSLLRHHEKTHGTTLCMVSISDDVDSSDAEASSPSHGRKHKKGKSSAVGHNDRSGISEKKSTETSASARKRRSSNTNCEGEVKRKSK